MSGCIYMCMSSFEYTRCVSCEQQFTDVNVYSELGWKETQISGLCETCFDEIVEDTEDNYD